MKPVMMRVLGNGTVEVPDEMMFCYDKIYLLTRRHNFVVGFSYVVIYNGYPLHLCRLVEEDAVSVE